MTSKCTCQTCGKQFRSQLSDSPTCYECAYTLLIANRAPEQGDIITAILNSGEMSDEDALSLQEGFDTLGHSGTEGTRTHMDVEIDKEGTV